MVVGVVDKVSGLTCRSAGLLAGRVHLTGTSGILVGGDPSVPMSLNGYPIFLAQIRILKRGSQV
jgi:hypothetical protein